MMVISQLDPLFMALLIAMFLFILATLVPWLISAARPKSKVTREEIVEVIGCTKCGYESMRKYEKGDYVGRIIGSCPKDGSSLIVKAIYTEKFSGSK